MLQTVDIFLDGSLDSMSAISSMVQTFHTYLCFGERGGKLRLDVSRLHETVELKGNDRPRIQSQGPRVLREIPKNVRRVKETNL